jgi:uncharacterized phage-associated protein
MTKAIDICNWFLASIDREAGDSITHLKLQKLVYYAQAWALAQLNKPLFEEDFEAWTHGPIVPSLFHQFKDNGWEALPYPDSVPIFNSDIETLLEEVLEVYGNLSARQLENLTQNEYPWKKARGNLPDEIRATTVISKEAMKMYYKNLFETLNEEQKEVA